MACGCNKNKTVYMLTVPGKEPVEFDDRQKALTEARIQGGTITTKVVPK